jgi:hypothetical protein
MAAPRGEWARSATRHGEWARSDPARRTGEACDPARRTAEACNPVWRTGEASDERAAAASELGQSGLLHCDQLSGPLSVEVIGIRRARRYGPRMHISKGRRLSYANIVATLALVFSMSGGALAASHYLVTSTKQIKPSVLKALKVRGKTGPAGPAGPAGVAGVAGVAGKEGAAGKQGPTGKEGSEGKQGKEGPLVAILPSGKTETGTFYASQYRPSGAGGTAYAIGSISYQFPLASEPETEVIQEGQAGTAHCPGSPAEPTAAKGYLCVYVKLAYETESTVNVEPSVSYERGAAPYAIVTGEAVTGQIEGSWAVTAP